MGWLSSRVVSVLDSVAEGPGRFKSQPRRCRVTVLGKLFTPVLSWDKAHIFLSDSISHDKQGDMLLVMGDFNAKVVRREPSAMSSAVGLYGLGETNEAGEQLEDFCLEHELPLANTMIKQHPRRLYTWTSADGNTRNQIDYISVAQRRKKQA